MSLNDCRECGHEVSNKARSCPACGAPDPADDYFSGQRRTPAGLARIAAGVFVGNAGCFAVVFVFSLIGSLLFGATCSSMFNQMERYQGTAAPHQETPEAQEDSATNRVQLEETVPLVVN